MKARRYELLAALLEYPGDGYHAALNRCVLALENSADDAGLLLAPLRETVAALSVDQVQEMFTRTFDINPVCTLEVGWHIYGEDYARGEFLVKMRELLREHRVPESRELPDHLTHVLTLLGRLEGEEADQLAALFVLPALEKMLAGVEAGEHPYRAVLETIGKVVRQDHDVQPVTPRARRGDPPDWNRRLPVVGEGNMPAGRDAGPRRGMRGGEMMDLDSATLHYLDQFLFAALPYLAFSVFFIGTIQRYRQQTFTYSSLSSQLLENKQHFWGMVPFHYGILVVLAGHVVAFLVPRSILAWNARPLRLYILEVSALICGMLALVGLVAAVIRRLRNPKVRMVTTKPDWVIFGMLLFQIFSGIYIAIFVGWGSSWFAAAAVPYLRSLVMFDPNIAYLAGMPWMARLHFINAFLLIAFFPFTRLVHILVVPNMYLWRKPQVVRWYAARPGQR